MPLKDTETDLLSRMQHLEKQLWRQRLAMVIALVLAAVAGIISFVASPPTYLRVRGITVVDERGAGPYFNRGAY